MFKALQNSVQIFSQGKKDISFLLSACLVVRSRAFLVNSNTMLVESWMLLIIKLQELHFLQSKLASATTVERGTEMSHCLHMKYQWKGKNTEERRRKINSNNGYFLDFDLKLICCESKVSLRFCPDRVAFPLPAAAFCLKVSKNSLILVLLIFLLNSLYTATIHPSVNSEAPTFA